MIKLNSINENSDKFYTSDIYYAGFLKCRGMEILGLNWDGSRCFFILKDHPSRLEFNHEFYGDGVVRITDYRNAISELKAMIHANRGAL